jgi:hypothetical protein
MAADEHYTIHTQGSMNAAAILNEHDVLAIKRMLHQGKRGADIARLFGVDKSTIYNIKQGKNWTHVTLADVQPMEF